MDLIVPRPRLNVGSIYYFVYVVLENDVPGNLVALSLPDQPIGVKGLEKFVVHAKVHKPLVRLLRSCVEPELGSDEGDDAGWGTGSLNYEEAVVELMCRQ
jgi:hypothetical protein